MRKPSFVFIGLDAAGPDLLRDWMNSGDLPNLALLRRSALWGNVLAAPGFGDCAVWNSLMTGVHLGRYGRYFNWQLKPGTYSLYRFNEDHDLTARQFWEFFGEAGLSCAVIDLVRAGLSRNLNGIQVADWLSHDPILAARSTPQALIAEMTAHYGKDPFGPLTTNLQTERPDPGAFLKAALKRIEAKTHFLERLVSEGRFDVIMAAYSDPHDIGHYAWHLHDRGHPEFDETMAERFGDPLKETYRALDQSIGRLLARLPAETTVMIFGGPGIGPTYSGRHLLQRVLDRLEYGHPRGISAFQEQVKDVYRLVAPDSVQRFIRARRGSERPKTVPRDDQWANRLCFMLPHNDNTDLIRINLEGREPKGRVKRADFDAFRARLARDLLELVDPATGMPAVKNVVDVVTTYPQPNAKVLPDLSVVWSTERPIRAVSSPKIGVVRGRFAPVRTGDHTPDCFFFLRAPGARPRELETPATYLDVAATIPGLVGVDVPGLDGRPIALE